MELNGIYKTSGKVKVVDTKKIIELEDGYLIYGNISLYD